MNMFAKLGETPLKNLDSAGLVLALQEEILQLSGSFNFTRVNQSIATATFLHIHQTRSNRSNLPRTPYIEHPLRNTLRLLRWGCGVEDIIIATLLHDTVEDCAARIAREVYGLNPKDFSEQELRDMAYEYLRGQFGDRVVDLVAAVTNDFSAPGATKEEKRKVYAEHVREAIKDPAVFLIKFADFVDNASGLYHNDIEGARERVMHLALKYLPVLDIFEEEFLRISGQLPISFGARRDIKKHLADTRIRLNRIIDKGNQ